MPILYSSKKETSVLNWTKVKDLGKSNNLPCKTIGMMEPCIESFATLQRNMRHPEVRKAMPKVKHKP